MTLNTRVRVVLTKTGLAQLAEAWACVRKIRPNLAIPNLDGDVFETELWDLMHIFGPALRMGSDDMPFQDSEVEVLT